MPLGWEPLYFSEVDPFCCRLLKEKYPSVPNYGDIAGVTQGPAVDLIIGGTPCQSFSVNGLRAGLDDARGNLLREFCRVVAANRPRWFIWENVPGVLSSNGGRDFGALVGSMVGSGYRLAWRVLDACGFGVPQARRRVFVVGHFGDWRRAAAVLIDCQARSKRTSSAKEVRKADGLSVCPSHGNARYGWTGDETPKWQLEATPTLRAFQGGEGVSVADRAIHRRLTPLEWERLQGFPDNYTAIDGATDRQRWRALGNAFATPVLRWIGNRIMELDRGC